MDVVIGIDPHNSSHHAFAVDDREVELAQLSVRATRTHIQRLLAWAEPFEPRTWAVEGADGLGYLLSQQLVAAGGKNSPGWVGWSTSRNPSRSLSS